MTSVPYQTAAELFRLLAHPARVTLLEMLREGERCVCELEVALGQRQAYVSQQLAILRDAELVAVRRDGWRIFYRVTQPEVFRLIDAARAITGEPRLVPVPGSGNRLPPVC